MWIVVALSVLAGWCLLSVPVALVVGRFITGPSPATSVSGTEPVGRDTVLGTGTASTA